MKFPVSTLLAIAAAPFLVAAATSRPNAFKIPDGGISATAGQSIDLKWNPTTSGTVSLILRSGASSNLEAGAYIAERITNSGMYSWNIPSSVTRGSDYTVQIVSDGDPTDSNFTPYFVINSDNTVATQTGTVTLGAPTESMAGSVTGTVSAESTSIASTTTADAESNTRSTTRTRESSSSSSPSTSESASETSSMTTTTRTSDTPSSTEVDAGALSTAALSTGASSANNVPALAAGVLALGALVF